MEKPLEERWNKVIAALEEDDIRTDILGDVLRRSYFIGAITVVVQLKSILKNAPMDQQQRTTFAAVMRELMIAKSDMDRLIGPSEGVH